MKLKMQKKIVDLKKLIRDFKQEYERLISLNDSLKDSSITYKTNFENLKVKFLDNEASLHQYKRLNHSTNNENESLKDKQTLLRIEINNLQKEISSTKDANFSLLEQHELLKSQFSTLLMSYNHKKAIDAKSIDLIKQIVSLQNKSIENEKKTIIQLLQTHSKKSKDFKNYIESILGNKGKLTGQILLLKTENKRLNSELRILKATNSKKQKIIEEYSKKNEMNTNNTFENKKEIFVLKNKVMVYEKLYNERMKASFKRRYSY